MPQMMPINWFLIFMMCLMCLLILMILINSLLLTMIFKNKKIKFNKKKWMWMW
nr:TPA_asm: ATP8 [Bombus difficillimus]